MKVLFLDVDGVLNNYHTKDRAPCGLLGLDVINLMNLQHIVENVDVSIILSSDWRLDRNKVNGMFDYLVTRLSEYNIKILDTTIDTGCYTARGFEISEYLKNHPEIDNYVILDDRNFPDFDLYGLRNNFIKTNAYLGLTILDAESAINILNS